VAYRLFFQPRAEKALVKAPRDLQGRLKDSILALASTPRPHGARVHRGERNTWRIVGKDPKDFTKVDMIKLLDHLLQRQEAV